VSSFFTSRTASCGAGLLEKLERSQHRKDWTDQQKIRFQKDLIKAEEFERFVHTNFIGQKRFSLEGGEGLIPALHYLIYTSAEHNLQEIVVGMAHRGRLNVLHQRDAQARG
jgi:2-oxoglutarate dehydrogenase E1 component